MSLHDFDLVILDDKALLEHRLSILDKWMDGINANPRTDQNGYRNETDTVEVSILNLPSLKRGNMASKHPLAKLTLILLDKERLHSWIQNYKIELQNSFKKDSIKTAIFREAATRLKMLLDHSDFDEGDLRVKRQKAIEEIDEMLSTLV